MHDRLSNQATVGRFGKQAAVMEIEGGSGRRPRTGEPFTTERFAVFHEGRDARAIAQRVRNCEKSCLTEVC